MDSHKDGQKYIQAVACTIYFHVPAVIILHIEVSTIITLYMCVLIVSDILVICLAF